MNNGIFLSYYFDHNLHKKVLHIYHETYECIRAFKPFYKQFDNNSYLTNINMLWRSVPTTHSLSDIAHNDIDSI